MEAPGYQNYHKHDHYSNIVLADSVATLDDYAKRAKELGHSILSSCSHGNQGNYLTLLDAAGVDPKTLQIIAGHGDIRITMNRYVHGREQEISDAGAKLNSLMNVSLLDHTTREGAIDDEEPPPDADI